MLKGFGNFLIKELKELARDPKILLGMIVVPLIMFPLLGGIMNLSIQTAQEQAQKAKILIVDNDGGNWSEYFINFVEIYANVSIENDITLVNDSVQNLLAEYNTTFLTEIPEGFSIKITEKLQGNSNITAIVETYSIFAGGSVFEGIGPSSIDILVNAFNRHISPDVLFSQKSAIIKGEIKEGVDPETLSGIMFSQAIALPITIMILLTYAMQIAATSVAMEKEDKTLETLLTLPMDRLAILMGKLSSSVFVAAIGALAYMIGYNYMLSSITASIPTDAGIDLASLGLVPSFLGYLLLGMSLFVTLLSALALAVIISAFSEDVRGAQSMVGYIYPLIFIPAFTLMYLDINALPFALKIVLYAIPFSQPVIASKAVVMGDYWTVIGGIVYVATFTLILLYVASRLFATEKILTAKFKFRGLRKREKTVSEEFQ